MSDLKPCPFCGDPMEGSVTDTPLGFAKGPNGTLMVQCDNQNCDTLGPVGKTMDEAVKLWNRRVAIAD